MNKKARKPAESKASSKCREQKRKAGRFSAFKAPVGEKTLLAVVFILAFLFRLIYLIQFSRAPNFSDPIGDSYIYYSRALEILAGNFWGNEIYFHSSPPYPYFIALIFRLSSNSFFLLRFVQILIGSANCCVIYLLAKKLSGEDKSVGFIAGVSAALYGVLAFFDADLLMIFLTLFFVDISLVLIIKSNETKRAILALPAGIFFGLGALDKTNLLLFAPFGAWFLLGEFSLKWKEWRWKPAILFSVGVTLMIVPVTIRNYVVGQEIVLVSSNAGVNLFVGNNPEGRGTFILPPGSGLRNTDLYGTSVEVAQKETGKKLGPSEVSRFWSAKAASFIVEQPAKAARLLLKKFILTFCSFEIPNHLNYYYIRQDFAPVLKFMFVGFWLITPIALVGIFWRWRRGLNSTDKLFIIFLAAYIASLVPFFVTARYRLPMVPILMAFAAATIVDMARSLSGLSRRQVAIIGAGLIASFAFVNQPQQRFSYSFNRVVMANKYFDRALKNKEPGHPDLLKAIVEYKRALEVDPLSTDAHYNLGRAYESVGYYSGAIREWEETLKIDPGIKFAAQAIQKAKIQIMAAGDRVDARAIPKTPYETAGIEEANGNHSKAMAMYENIVRDDPFHFMAYNNMGFHYYRTGQYDKAVKLFERGLKIKPDHFYILNNLAGIYYKQGKLIEAKELWLKCLEIQPDSELIRKQLKMIDK